MYFTYHDLKVNTDQIAYRNRVGGGQFLTLKFDRILMVYIYLLIVFFQSQEWRNGLPFISTAKDGKGGEGGLSIFNVEV